jgi:hypothetical protein
MNGVAFRLDVLDSELAERSNKDECERIIALRSHPRFLEGLKSYAALIPDYFSNNLVLNRVVTEAWRFEILVYLLYLYDTKDSSDPRSGLTLSNLQKLCKQQNVASSGRVLAIVGIMRFGGYLERIKATRDNRVVQLKPSEAFVDIVEGWNYRLLTIIDSIMQEENLTDYYSGHPRFGWVMRRRGAEDLIAGWKLLEKFPEVNHFLKSDGGWMLLLTCVAKSLALGAYKTIEPISLDLRFFGATFGVSRSHLRRLLESAFAQGLLDMPPRNGSTILLSERLVASFLTCMASELSFYLLQARATKTELGLCASS